VVVVVRATHNPDFETKITVQDYKDVDEDLRFALYDLDSDDRIAEEELVGEAVIKASQISSGGAVTLALTKRGRAVPDAFILLNSSKQQKQAVIADAEAKERAAAEAQFKAGQERNQAASVRVAAEQKSKAAQDAYSSAAEPAVEIAVGAS
jgi:hypothetical protein